MNRNKIKFVENESFEKKINIRLCNELINFIISTSSKEGNDTVKDIKQRCIWFNEKRTIEIQNIYGIQYFGELLERYEQKIGNDIKNLRAISLALGYAKDLVTDNMIIGTQLVDFINKIKNLAKEDIYLQGALYLYDNKKYFQYEEQLLNRKYDNTEDLFFVLSLLIKVEKAFFTLKDQIISLIGRNKTISSINNVKIYAWLINNFFSVIKKERKKDVALLKTLLIIPTKQIKDNSEEYKILIENNYKKEEIMYLNYSLLYFVNTPKKVRLGKSITEERIAINLCKIILNNTNQQHIALYELIKNMLIEYRYFDIKCEGKEGLNEALKNEIEITNPITFLEFYEEFGGNIFTFDILEKKWDILSIKMESNKYKKLFDDFIQYNDFSKEKIERCIEKYNKLTDTSYLESFFEFNYKREDIFTQLVNKNIISLKEHYSHYEQQNKTEADCIIHLKEYVEGIKYRNAFLFLQYILEEKKYKIEDIDSLNFNLKHLYRLRKYSYYGESEVDIQKDFLSKEEKEKLFFWLDNYMFKMHPDEYIEFIVNILKVDNINDIIPKEQLREIYFMLKRIDNNIEKDTQLRNKYLTQEELQKISNKEKMEEEQRKMQEYLEKQEKIINTFNKLPKESFKEVYDFCYKYRWNDEEWNICKGIIKKYLCESIHTFKINEDEIIELIKLFKLLLEKKTIDAEEFKEYILRYMREENVYNGIIKKAC